jgi:ubiquinone/menaquinone biosynthesis C-methylase UbiE
MSNAEHRASHPATDNVTVDDVKKFWSENPMSYFIDASQMTRERFEEVDRKFYTKSVPCYTPPGGIVYSRYIDYKSEIAGKKVLEIGYGLGTMQQAFYDNGGDVHGIDLSTAHYQAAQARMQLFDFKTNAVCDNAERLPFPDDTFDFVFSHGVIHHTPKTEEVVDEIYRVLKPGGKVLVMVYHWDSMRVRWKYHIKHWLFRLRNGMKVFCSIQESLNYHSDNHDKNRKGSPLAKAYTRTGGAKLFGRFRNLYIDVTGDPKEFEEFPIRPLGRLIPQSLKQKWTDSYGYFLMIKGEK